MILLMTRPRDASERFVANLKMSGDAGVRVVYSPLLQIRPTVTRIDPAGAGGLIFSSANGVSIAASAMQGRDLPCFCVGEQTTARATSAGWQAKFCGRNAAELMANLLMTRPEGPLLHIHGRHTRGDIAQTLTSSGLVTREVVIYDQHLLALTDEAQEALGGQHPVIAPLFSPRTARQFAEQSVISAPLWLGALSGEVAKPLENVAFKKLCIAERPDTTSMLKLIEKLAKAAKRVESR